MPSKKGCGRLLGESRAHVVISTGLQTVLGPLHGFSTHHGGARLLDISSPLCARKLPRVSSTGVAEIGHKRPLYLS